MQAHVSSEIKQRDTKKHVQKAVLRTIFLMLSLLTLSQAELAEFVGATREAVSKTLSLWKRAGVIDASRGGVTVIDREALQVLADLHQI